MVRDGFKRRFPKFEKCCYILPKRISIIISTVFILIMNFLSMIGILFLGSMYFNGIQEFNNFGVIIITISLISQILLLYGLKKDNLDLIKQFKMLFLPFIFFTFIIYTANSIVLLGKNNRRTTVDAFMEYYEKEQRKDNTLVIPTEDEIKKGYDSFTRSSITIYIITVAIYIWYYISTCSYIEDIEEIAYEENKARNMENNDKEMIQNPKMDEMEKSENTEKNEPIEKSENIEKSEDIEENENNENQ